MQSLNIMITEIANSQINTAETEKAIVLFLIETLVSVKAKRIR